MTKAVICPCKEVPRLSRHNMHGCAWLYLGKDLEKREAVASWLDEKGLMSLGNRLHEMAERIRQPFLDFIADLGKIQTDSIGWWSSACSRKDSEQSDLFLLVCYGHLVRDLVEDTRSQKSVIIIEDPWLFRQLKEVYADDPRVRFAGQTALWPIRLQAFVRGLGSRIVWSLRLLWYQCKQRWVWKSDLDSSSVSPAIGLYSLPQYRSLRGTDGWVDPYLGNLDKLLEKSGYSVLRFSPPEAGGFERALAQRSHFFAPLILWMTPMSLIRSLLASWHIVWPRDPQVDGLSIRWLLLREWRLDRWRSSYPLFRIFFDSLSNLLTARRLELLLYPYENQPWERLLVFAARAHAVPTLGYQHEGPVSRFLLPYFHASDEAAWAPMPDLILASGLYSQELLAMGGIPHDRLIMVGNVRHQYLWGYQNFTPLPETGSRRRVLVALPLNLNLAQHLLHALRRAFPDGGVREGIEFAVKPHPMYPMTGKMLNWPARILAGSFEEALRGYAVVLYCGSVTGLEALVMGRVVLRYRAELLLNVDPAEFFKGEAMVDCGDHDLKEKVLSLLQGESRLPSRRTVEEVLDRVFSLPNQGAWLQAVEQLCPIRSIT